VLAGLALAHARAIRAVWNLFLEDAAGYSVANVVDVRSHDP